MTTPDLKPAMPLTPAQLEQVSDAIVDSLSPGELANALRFKWGMVLTNYVGTDKGFIESVGQLIGWTDRRGKTRELANLVLAERPGNGTVQRMATSLGLAYAEVEQKYDLTKPLPAKPTLEAMVARNSRLVDYGKFLERYQSLGVRLCKIETPKKVGTGFLVGANLVLTNYHVVDAVKSADDARRTKCRFDFNNAGDAVEGATEPTAVGLATDWCVASSPYSDSDLTGVGEADADQLDYALLRLNKNAGDERTSTGNERGWFDLKEGRPLLAVRDFVVIAQHPRGRKLEMAWGAVSGFNGSGTRVRYDTTTDEGSSGGPCLTADLQLFGLHHATDPRDSPEFNQAIPLDMIERDLAAKHAV